MGTAVADAVQVLSNPRRACRCNSAEPASCWAASVAFCSVQRRSFAATGAAGYVVLGSMVDGLIMVIDSGEIKVEMAREVKNQLVHAGAGVVLNKVRSEHHGYMGIITPRKCTWGDNGK